MDLLGVFLNLITALISVYFSYMFFGLFAPKRTDKWLVNWGMIILSSILFFVTLYFVSALLPRMILIIGITLAISLLFSAAWYNYVLLSVVIYTLNGATEIFVSATVSTLFAVDMASCFKGKFLVLGLFLSKIIVFIIISLIRAKKHKLLHVSFQRHFLSLFIIPLSTFAIFLLQYSHLRYFSELSTVDSLLTMLCYSLLLVANILVFNILDGVYNTVEKDYRLVASEKLISLQEEQYRQLLEHNQTVLKIKHDQKNFLIGVLADLDSKNYSDIRSSAEAELNNLNIQSIPPGQNNVIYSMVNHKTQVAAEKGIILSCEYHELQKIEISPIDIAIILGNALDNAIEATEKVDPSVDKTISLLIKIHNEQIIIIIKNPTKDTVNPQNMKSTKDSLFHGFGITSMTKLAHAHNGDIIFTANDNTFETHIILCNINE